MPATRPTAAQRGYDYAHQKRRRRAARNVAMGRAVCWRCGMPIDPNEPWDLGHDDKDRSITRGPEHLRCNRATSSRRPSRRRPAEPHPGLIERTTR